MKMATKLNAKNIYYSFAEARKARNISQVELSKKTGIIQADISRIENGKANPTLDVLKRLAEALEMKINISFEDK
ncbi:MAG: helix-turn-helix transcriptional regulator [Treponema sp.]|nr:helix-turn-helix transcriptional regulator [Treponema sp.]